MNQAQRQIDIGRSVANAFALQGIEDTYANRVLFCKGMLLAWKSEISTSREDSLYIRALAEEIEFYERMVASVQELSGT
jgi:hypothetical protein